MDRGVELVLLVGGLLVGAAVVWFSMRQRLPVGAVERIAQAAAEVFTILGDAFTTDDVRRLAGFMWDTWGAAEEYFTREQFIELVIRAVTRARVGAPVIRASAMRSAILPFEHPKDESAVVREMPEALSGIGEAIGGKPS